MLLQLVQLVVGGNLPCSKEEAATLAGIQLRLEESWGRPSIKDSGPMSPVEASALRTISEDKVSAERRRAGSVLGIRLSSGAGHPNATSSRCRRF